MTFEHFLRSCFGVYCIALIKMLKFHFIYVLCHNLWKYKGLYICITAEISFSVNFYTISNNIIRPKATHISSFVTGCQLHMHNLRFNAELSKH
jgi:hypothetical protein